MSANWKLAKWWLTPKRDGERWRRANLIEKLLPGMCWSSLVDWAMQGRVPRDERIRLRDCRINSSCRGDNDLMARCYCGKLKRTTPPPCVQCDDGLVVTLGGEWPCDECEAGRNLAREEEGT